MSVVVAHLTRPLEASLLGTSLHLGKYGGSDEWWEGQRSEQHVFFFSTELAGDLPGPEDMLRPTGFIVEG